MMEYPKNSLASQNSHLSSVSATHYKHDDSMVVMNAPIKRGELNRETEFKNIKITHIDNELPENVIRELLESHYCRFGPMNVQILKEGFNRTVYVNFESPQDARKAWKDAVTMVSQLLGITARVEPAGLMKSRCPSVKEEKRSRSSSGFGVHASCPDTSVTDEFGRRKEPNREMFPIFRLTMCMPEEKQSVRVLFVGKLKSSISERCLQTAFEQFGPIDSIFIKRHGTYGFKTFAFVRFENAKMAREAKSAMAGYEFDGVPCIVGYGKPVPSRLLWVYGLGDVVRGRWLCDTFTRFGTIDCVLAVRSQQTLYILYEKKECAMEACNALKGKLIDDGKTDKRFEVDFVDPNLMDKYASVGRILVPPGSEFNGRSCGHVQSYRVLCSLNSGHSSTEMLLRPQAQQEQV